MANDYKVTQGKPPVVRAVFIPFGRTLLALAAMMQRQAVRHKLQGAKDPYQEWRQLPNAKEVLTDAGGRHALDPWSLNAKDRVGDHPGDLHILHAIWGLMAGYEKYLEEQDAKEAATKAGHWPTPPGFDPTKRDHVLARELAAHHRMVASIFGPHPDLCCEAPDAQPIHGPAGADWREPPHQVVPRCTELDDPLLGNRASQCVLAQDHPGAHNYGDHYS